MRLLLRLTPAYGVLAVVLVAAGIMGAPLERLTAWGAAGLLYLAIWTGLTAIIAAVPRRSELLPLAAAGV